MICLGLWSFLPRALVRRRQPQQSPELYNVTILIRARQARVRMMLNKGPCREMVAGPNLDHCPISGELYKKILSPLVVIEMTRKNAGLLH